MIREKKKGFEVHALCGMEQCERFKVCWSWEQRTDFKKLVPDNVCIKTSLQVLSHVLAKV